MGLDLGRQKLPWHAMGLIFIEYGGDTHGTSHGDAVACDGKCHGTCSGHNPWLATACYGFPRLVKACHDLSRLAMASPTDYHGQPGLATDTAMK